MTQSEPSESSEHVDVETEVSAGGEVELIDPRHKELHGFHFKVRASGRIYRLESARDPQLPRFWCFSVSRCVASGVIDESEHPWFGGDRMTREELPDAVEAIRSALADWLMLPQHRALRAWVLNAPPLEVPAGKLSSASARSVRTL